MKKTLVLIFIIILAVVIFVDVKPKNKLSYETTPVQIGSTIINAEIADTQAKRELGLSGRLALPADHGMLFVFDQPGRHGFWMKDMNFPIDIIWLDENKQIIGTTKNLQSASSPQIFYPPQEIRYALEIKAN